LSQKKKKVKFLVGFLCRFFTSTLPDINSNSLGTCTLAKRYSTSDSTTGESNAWAGLPEESIKLIRKTELEEILNFLLLTVYILP
jgi:hypothetical protein